MTKKRLSDLLKEEASKSETPGEASSPVTQPAVQADPTQLPQAEEAKASKAPAAKTTTARKTTSSRRASSNRRTSTSRAAASQVAPPTTSAQPELPTPEVAAEPVAEPPVKVAEAKSETPPDPALAQLEAVLATLTQEKAALEKTVQGLQSDLAAQQTRLFELKDSLDKAEAVAKAKTKALEKSEAALAEAKQTILKLTDTQATASVPAKAPALEPTPMRRSGGDIIPRQPMAAPSKPGYVRGVPTYTAQSDQPNPMLSDADIGWVD
jgi:hypothetical protein